MKLRSGEKLLPEFRYATKMAMSTLDSWEKGNVPIEEQYYLATQNLIHAQESFTLDEREKEEIISCWKAVLTLLDERNKNGQNDL